MVGDLTISDSIAVEGTTEGRFIDVFAADSSTLMWPADLTFGPDGNLYVLGRESSNVVRFNGVTGAFMDEFVPAGSAGLLHPNYLSFGPDGNLYAASLTTHADTVNRILRFDGVSGAPLPAPGNTGAEFVTTASGGLSGARSPVFGPDGSLYVSSVNTNQVLRYDGTTGNPTGQFIGDHLSKPGTVRFRYDGMVYVSNTGSNSVTRFNSITGEFIDEFVASSSGGLSRPNDMEFGPDGNLYVVSEESNSVLQFNGATGHFIDVFAANGAGGLGENVPFISFGNDGLLYVANDRSNNVLRFGNSIAAFTVTLSSPNASEVTVNYSSADGSAISSDFIASSGTITFAPGENSRTILVQTFDDSAYEGNETFVVNLSNAVGGVIVDSQGIATIVDNDAPTTKFYIINDATQNRTYEYGETGSSIENYALNSGNSAPRGAASTAAGDQTWIVDANKKVYVYNSSGGLLGSWTAGSLASNATVEGIATNGTDVWIVDARNDRVYRYAGAADRLSASQNAASSFALNSGNRDPKDLVTDGVHLWVVNDSATDKVYKYTLAGSLVGSWTLSSGGGSSTGITIDPANVSDVWVVDNATDRVYQYTAAASRTAGSQSPAGSFALAAGNTNPQGIADPSTANSQVGTQAAAVTGNCACATCAPSPIYRPSLREGFAAMGRLTCGWPSTSCLAATRSLDHDGCVNRFATLAPIDTFESIR